MEAAQVVVTVEGAQGVIEFSGLLVDSGKGVAGVNRIKLFLLTRLFTIHIEIILRRDRHALVWGMHASDGRSRKVIRSTEVQRLIHLWLVEAITKRFLACSSETMKLLTLIRFSAVTIREHDRAAEYLAHLI